MKNKENELIYEPRPGEGLKEAAKNATTIAERTREVVILIFNEIIIRIEPGDESDYVIERCRDLMRRRY